jgi:WNK lysine deficient protein kinase
MDAMASNPSDERDIAEAYDRLAARQQQTPLEDGSEDEDEVVEQDPEGNQRFSTRHPLPLSVASSPSPPRPTLGVIFGPFPPLAARMPTAPCFHESCSSHLPSTPPVQTHKQTNSNSNFAAGRFSRYKQIAGSGRFKTVFRAFDERRGVDVAWSKVNCVLDGTQLSQEQIERAVDEMSVGLCLDHPNVIRCYQCWEDPSASCINLITEFFTSGNLREYRRRHKAMDLKAVKKWGRQILQGLAYLHGHDPPVVHGDLRPDKIYINGHSGEIKIGDLGLSTLVPKRFAPGVMPEGDPTDHYTEAVDIFAYGLVMLELTTMKKMDRYSAAWMEALQTIPDDIMRDFIERCLAPEDERPTAAELLKHPFIVSTKSPTPVACGSTSSIGGGGMPLAESSLDGKGGLLRDGSSTDRVFSDGGIIGAAGPAGGTGVGRRSTEDAQRAECEAGSVRGEDYLFQFTGKIKYGKLHFRLHMQYEGDDDDLEHGVHGDGGRGTSKTIDFVYDPEEDTPDEIAAEISSEFNLSSTDCDICAAALKEWLADQAPDAEQR